MDQFQWTYQDNRPPMLGGGSSGGPLFRGRRVLGTHSAVPIGVGLTGGGTLLRASGGAEYTLFGSKIANIETELRNTRLFPGLQVVLTQQ